MKKILRKAMPLLAMACLLAANASGQNQKMRAYLVSDAHLDTQWNWDVQTTIREYVKNTIDQNLFLLEKYPEYIFNFEGGVKYSWMKEYYPLQYEKLKKYVGEGRWHLTGSGWDANEVIICSPESWIRNILLGQTFYRQEFGTESTDVFLPDCFGFGYTLPTLANHCGLIGFSSQKLGWRTKPFYEGNKRYPFTVGLWQGIDGSRIMMAHGFDYGRRWDGTELSSNEILMNNISENPLGITYRYYGTGDVGGSPTLASVQSVVKGMKGNGPIEIVSATSDQLYKDFLPYEQHPELPVYDGELLMDLHGNGCYTSQAAMKLYNRQNEHLGDAAERTAVMADWLGTTKYPIQRMTDTWRRMIWHQFHDDVTGTSIPRAYEFSWNDELLALKTFSQVLTHSVSDVISKMDTRVKGTPIVVYNNETFPVNSVATVELNDNKNYTVTDAKGKRVVSQTVERDGRNYLLFDAQVPATGFAVYGIQSTNKVSEVKEIQGSSIENSEYRLTVNEQGDVVSVYDKRYQKELVAEGKSLRLVVLDDCKSYQWPAWEILKATLDRQPLPIHNDVMVSMTEGPLRKTLTVEKKYGETSIVQRIHLYEGGQARRIDFENDVDWKSLNALLKAEFPLSVSNEKASYDIGLGSVKRGNNRDNAFEVYAHEWTDLTDRSGDYGVTFINDSKYGWDKPQDNTLRLSLLYSPKTNGNYDYQAYQDLGHHVFTYSIIGHQGKLRNADAAKQALVLNSKLKSFVSTKHQGLLGNSFSFLSSDNDQVFVRALKRAEVSDEYVVRVYEMGGKQTQRATLTFASDIAEATEVDGTEKTKGTASFSGKGLQVVIKPFSVKTFKVKLKNENRQKMEVDAYMLPLTYDRQCFSYNEFRSSGNFEGGYSYAAELMPEGGLCVDGIPFRFGEFDAKSGMTCQGQKIKLPSEKNYQHIYLLAASDKDDRMASFMVGKTEQTVSVPFYSGFVGQWGHDGQSVEYLRDAEVAYVGSHRHSSGGDEPYEFTYMYKIRLDVPKNVREITLPNDPHIVIFAATAANDMADMAPASQLFETSFKQNMFSSGKVVEEKNNVLKDARIINVSGECNEREKAVNLTDDNPDTKWCDVSGIPHCVVFDLGKQTTVGSWHLLNAGAEHFSYITRTCLLQGRNAENEEWQTLDMIDGNRNNVVQRSFQPTEVRYVRLYVVGPEQGGGGATRIYEFGLY